MEHPARLLAPPELSPRQLGEFAARQGKLRVIYDAIESRLPFDHTSIVVPSLSFDAEELAKIPGVPFYEERLLFSLIRLRHPRARVVYVTSQPIHPDIVDYYLQHLVGVPASHARSRLAMMCVFDASARPLTAKILERPRFIERIRRWMGDPDHTYLTCFNSTAWERVLSVRLGVPLNAVDPNLLDLGTKSGCRKVFREAGVDLPKGFEDVHSRQQVVESLEELTRFRPGLRRAVVKLDESFAGAGNALYRYPTDLPEAREERRAVIDGTLDRLEWAAEETLADFLRKLGTMGGIVEEYLEAEVVRSPSVQMRIAPDGEVELISSHDQVLSGATGQVYSGCRFPAAEGYRALIQEQAMKIGRVLADKGVISRYAIDFLVWRDGDEWRSAAIEINLRMGGTTPPFLALQFLTGGEIDQTTGMYISPRGQQKFYYATDNLGGPTYRGLLPEDFIDILTLHGLHFRPQTETGVLFHMIGALSEFGKVGVTCIGNSREEADELYRRTVAILDLETDAEGSDPNLAVQLFDPGLGRME